MAAACLSAQRRAFQAIIASSGTAGLISKATAILSDDIMQLPFPDDWDLGISQHEQVLIDDIVDYYRDLIRLGEDSAAMRQPGHVALPDFNKIYLEQVNAVYRKRKLRALSPQVWPGVVCQPFVFGRGTVNWSGADELRGRLDAVLRYTYRSHLRRPLHLPSQARPPALLASFGRFARCR
jgi:hypothetical protein